MPIGVNLLPWRAERDRRARRRMWLAMPTATLIGLGIMLMATLVIREMHEERLDANTRVRQQIDALADRRAATEQLKRTHGALSRRMAAMEALLDGQTRALDELTGLMEALPHDVRLMGVERGAERLVIEGLAPAPVSVSALITALRASPRFPALRFERLTTRPAQGHSGDRFRIVVRRALERNAGEGNDQGVQQ